MTQIIRSTRASRNKAKGNKFENDIAKTLSNWMFGNEITLGRDITSGAIKTGYYQGDIIPVAPIPFKEFIFFIETKTGYNSRLPTFNNFDIIKTWLLKCIKFRTERQCIIYLIAKFSNKSPLLITDVSLNIFTELMLNIKVEEINSNIPFFIYDLKELLRYNFLDLYRNNSLVMEILS